MNGYKFFLLSLFALVSCSQVEPDAIIRQEMTYRVFDSRESLYEAISRGDEMNTKSVDNSTSLSLFVSLNECDVQNDPILSYECLRRGITDYQTSQTVYDLLGYDELVPNEDFARLLNPQGMICVRDTLYKISPRGTYYFPASAMIAFEQMYPEYEQSDGVIIADDTYLIDTTIFRFDTFKEESPVLTVGYNPDEIGSDSDSMNPDRSWPSFSWSNYPTYSGTANTRFRNQVFTYSLPNSRRIWTKVFHNDYVVYDERGVTLKCQKQGTIGWSAVTSEALLVTMKNLIVRVPYVGETPPPSNIDPTQFTATEYLWDDQPETVLVIKGYVLPEDQINYVVSGGQAALRTVVLSEAGLDIYNHMGYRAVFLKGHDYYQIVFLGAWPFSGTYTEKVRQVLFNHTFGRAANPIGGQFWYQALDDNNNFGALRVGTAF